MIVINEVSDIQHNVPRHKQDEYAIN